MAAAVSQKIRREDFLARYGGEEFAIILPEITHASAMVMGEKIRSLVEQQEFVFEDTQIPTTISIGVATLNEEINEGIELIKLADKNLYKAKKSGRNKVCG